MFDGRWRTGVDRVTGPVASGLGRTGATADHLTALGLALGVATAVAVASGRLGLGLVLLVGSALPDLLDGPLAKAAGTASPRGAFFDSVADRVTDALVLGGIGWYLASDHGGHAALLPFAVLAASALVSYERAKAESLGYSARGGLMERAERIIALSFGLAFSALLVPVLWVMLALTLATAVQRFAMVWSQASAPRVEGEARPAMEARWRAWREAREGRGAASWRSGRPRRQAWRTRSARAARDERWRRRRVGTRP